MEFFVLAVIHVDEPKVDIAQITINLDEPWMVPHPRYLSLGMRRLAC